MGVVAPEVADAIREFRRSGEMPKIVLPRSTEPIRRETHAAAERIRKEEEAAKMADALRACQVLYLKGNKRLAGLVREVAREAGTTATELLAHHKKTLLCPHRFRLYYRALTEVLDMEPPEIARALNRDPSRFHVGARKYSRANGLPDFRDVRATFIPATVSPAEGE